MPVHGVSRSGRAQYGYLLRGGAASSPAPSPSLRARQKDSDESAPVGSLDALFARLSALREEDERAAEAAFDRVGATRMLLGFAPSAALDGCWLAKVARARNAGSELGAACIEACWLEHGEGDAARHHGNLFRAALAARGMALGAPVSEAFQADTRFEEADFELALAGLELGTAREDRWGETLGFHAASAVIGPPAPVLRALVEGAEACGFAAAHAVNGEIAARVRGMARRALDAYLAGSEADLFAGLMRGVSRLVDARRAWYASLLPREALTAWGAMIALVTSKAPHAFGFHRHVRVESKGEAIDRWFDPASPDPRALLEHIARSRWVVPGRPDESPLLTRATAFGGPMFGVFTGGEMAVVRAWIAGLSEQPTAPVEPPPEVRTAARVERGPAVSRSGAGEETPPLPDLYHRLLTAPDDEGTRDLARAHLERTFQRAARKVSVASLTAKGLWPWSSGALQNWVDGRLREQVVGDGDGPLAGVEKAVSREEIVRLLTQVAPAAFIDGAWAQGAIAPAICHTEIASLLGRIYRDELGAGVPRQHHGNVLRSALARENVHLPPCDSEGFVRWPGFLPEAFSMPVLWLSIALHTGAYFPELLGLNLAVEMAGIGSGYAFATGLCRKHGIDPYFFELHNTIDNAASGHTAWSTQALSLYMDGVLHAGGPAAVEQATLAVWRGHAAYEVASRPLLLALALRFGPRMGLRWIYERARGATPWS